MIRFKLKMNLKIFHLIYFLNILSNKKDFILNKEDKDFNLMIIRKKNKKKKR